MTLRRQLPEKEHVVHKWLPDLEIKIKVLENLNYRTMGFRELLRKAVIYERQLRRVLPSLEKARHVKCKPPEKRGQKMEISITERGKAFLLKYKPLEELARVFFDAFTIAFTQVYEKGNVATYQKFLEDIESPLRDFLNKNMANETKYYPKIYFDPNLLIHPMNLDWLLQDAREAKNRGDYLTANHRYVLEKIDGIEETKLVEHNVKWKSKVEKQKFTGKEKHDELTNAINPNKIVENEREKRKAITKQKHQSNYENIAMSFARNNYEHYDRWKIDVAKLMDNFRKAS